MGHKVLVIGANGLLGRKVVQVLTSGNIDWIGTYNNRPEEGLIRLDVTDQQQLSNTLSEISPDAIFNLSNLAGGVDFCENNAEKATGFHFEPNKIIAEHCKRTKIPMVYISSDYVFDGTKPPYKEDDKPNPLNLYGKLKLQTEDYIRKTLQDFLIIRTTNIYGWDPKTVTPNYMMGLYKTIKDGRNFNAPSFLWGNPTYAGDLASAIVELYQKKAKGVYHVCGSSYVTRYEWAKEACRILGLDEKLLNEVKEPSANSSSVPRPLKSCLSIDKFRETYKTTLHDLTGGLSQMKSNMDNDGK